MAIGNNNMANTEDIEARLCAYVDGDLDAAGRAEIERHLSMNPQHRSLIEELSHQRQLLRALPRARAPLDIAESLNAQLERSALLSEEEWHEPIRISRWPQIRAAAAVLLLVFGLAAVVYYVVPSPNQPHPGLVLNPAIIQPQREAEEAEPTPGATGLVTVSRGEPDAAMALSDQQQRSIFALNQELSDAHRRDVMSNAVPLGRQIMVDAIAAAPQPLRMAQVEVKMLVAAADPVATHRQVQSYLENRRIEIEHPTAPAAAAPHQLALDPSQQRGGERIVIPQLPGYDAFRDRFGDAPAREEEHVAESGIAHPHAMRMQDIDNRALQAGVGQERALIARGMTRGDVERLRHELASTGQQAQVIDQSPAAEFRASDIDPKQWKVQALLPFAAQSQAGAASQLRPFNLDMLDPTSADADEPVDVLILVRQDDSQQPLVTEQQEADAPDVLSEPAEEDEEDDDAPPAAPTTEPSAP